MSGDFQNLGDVRTHRDLDVWKRSFQLSQDVYRMAERFPPSVQASLGDQMRRSSLSIPSNIAEGSARGSRIEYRRFVGIARGSGAELETQVLLARALGHAEAEAASRILGDLSDVLKMLTALRRSLSASPT